MIGWIGSWPARTWCGTTSGGTGCWTIAFVLKGFFNESLPPVFGSTSTERPVTINNAPTLALLRIDADAYDGVLDALEGAYHRLSPGGFVIIDDWHLGGARAAVHAFRRRFSIKGPIRSSPSDLVLTCGVDLREVASCATGRALLAQSKAYTVTVLPHVAYWRKGPGPSFSLRALYVRDAWRGLEAPWRARDAPRCA